MRARSLPDASAAAAAARATARSHAALQLLCMKARLASHSPERAHCSHRGSPSAARAARSAARRSGSRGAAQSQPAPAPAPVPAVPIPPPPPSKRPLSVSSSIAHPALEMTPIAQWASSACPALCSVGRRSQRSSVAPLALSSVRMVPGSCSGLGFPGCHSEVRSASRVRRTRKVSADSRGAGHCATKLFPVAACESCAAVVLLGAHSSIRSRDVVTTRQRAADARSSQRLLSSTR